MSKHCAKGTENQILDFQNGFVFITCFQPAVKMYGSNGGQIEENKKLYYLLLSYLFLPFFKEGGIVGVDMEWQPTFGCISTQQVALIQLAVLGQVFLLDLCANGFCQHPDTIIFIRSLFSERSILKLGKMRQNMLN